MQMAGIDAALRDYFRGCLNEGASPSTLQLMGGVELEILTRAEGYDPGPEELKRICQIPENFMREERARWRNSHMYKTDAKGWADKHLPRISRHRDNMWPMDWITADCTKINIYLRRPDGSLATPWAVLFADEATHRFHITLYLLPKGEGISNALVVKAFIRMVTDWGAPGGLYTDNGKEFNWADLIGDLYKLSLNPFGERGPRHVRALPYNAAAKALVEGGIAVLERTFMAGEKGYVGGNRMAKKTANLGQGVVPWNGDLKSLQAQIDAHLILYHHKKKRGTLRGRSPFEVYEAAGKAGWRPTVVDPQALLVALRHLPRTQVSGPMAGPAAAR